MTAADDPEEPMDSLIAAVARIPARDPQRRPTEWAPPGELDEYRLIRPLGRGGMGSVWLAEDRLLERLVAVKFIAHAEPDPSTRARFAIEARAAARLQHENVVTVHRYGELSGRPYLISEYIRGNSLDTVAKPMSWPRVLELGVGLARGLAAAHRHGIVHRDIKPANAIVTPDGQAKLVDFGLAKLGFADPAATTMSAQDPIANITVPGAIAGTPRYLAPEVRSGDPASRRSDVYQLGCILYELVAGRAPILELRGGATATTDEDVPSLHARTGPTGARFAAVVDRRLRRDPNERYASGDELREALEQIAAPAPGGELPEGNPYRGLLAFDAEHRALFFGRGPDIRAVIERLRAERFVLVTGDSGVGKSSLCRAGVLPHVTAGSLGDAVAVVRLLPGRKPATGLAAVLSELVGLDDATVSALMRDDPTQLLRELRRAKRQVVVFVDQLEEITTVADRGEAELFATTLGHLVDGAPAVRVLATVRSDFVTRVAALPMIGADLARSLYVLRPLTDAGAHEAVVGPARAKGARFESDQLVDAIAGQAVELPLLAFTLAQLWEARDTATQVISARSVDAIGGVRGALARHADGVLDNLVPAQRAAARKLLLRLVTAERTRIRRTAEELAGVEDAVLDALVRGRLVIARGGDTPTFELVHEKLIDGWPALAGWLTETTEAIAVHARLAGSVADWERLDRARDGLWSERQLAGVSIVPADELTVAERAFVDASRRAVSRRRFARRAIAVAVPLVFASIYIGGRVIARRDLASHVADNVADAERRLDTARVAAADDAKLQREAFALFDANDTVRGEVTWAAANDHLGVAQSEYAAAAQMLEAAFLLDTDRDDVRHELARVTYERLLLADRDHRVSDARELATRLALYDDDGELRRRLAEPASVALAIHPADASVQIDDHPAGASIAPGSHMLVASAPGRTAVRVPLVLAPGERRRVELELPASIPGGLVYVAAGSFLYGSRDGEGVRAFFATVPMHEVRTDAFLIGTTEVTYESWLEFVDALPATDWSRRLPRVETSPTVGAGGVVELREVAGAWTLRLTPANITYDAAAGAPIVYRERLSHVREDWRQMPVTGISPDDAQAYTEWLDRTGRVPHARLCSEREWEHAMRGVDGRSYPHGDRLAPDDANFDKTYGQREGGFGPDVVGSHPASTSPYGLVDGSGNAAEIVRSGSGTGFVSRGGCYYTDASSAHLANRQEITSTYRHVQIGVRICADP